MTEARVCRKCASELTEDLSPSLLKVSLCRGCKNGYRMHKDEHLSDADGDERTCTRCEKELPSSFFYANNRSKCKACVLELEKERRQRKRAADELDGTFEVVETLLPEPEQTQKKDHLYIMMNPKIPGELKVGRSHDPTERARALSKSQNFSMEILKVYHCQGYNESTVHKRLKIRNVTDGDGQEWFKIDSMTLDMIVQGVIAESQL